MFKLNSKPEGSTALLILPAFYATLLRRKLEATELLQHLSNLSTVISPLHEAHLKLSSLKKIRQ
jgi:hypothetical protein